jgi:type I restriction enzyme, S subunit
VATLQRGFDLPTRRRKPGVVPIVSSSGISGWHDQAMVKAPGVVTGRYGTIGEVFYQTADFWPLNTTLWISDFHGNSPRFIYYLLQRIEFDRHSGKSGVPGVNRNDLHLEPVTLPRSTHEQEAIADALTDADRVIAALVRMTDKKQSIKQGIMQQLLTGRIRFPGFSESWRKAVLDDVAMVDPETLPAQTDPEALFDYISLEDVERGRLLGHSQVRFGSAPSRARRVLREMDVLFGTVRPHLQSHMLYQGALRHPIASTGFSTVRANRNDSDSRFLFYLLMSHLTTEQIDRIIAGSNYPAVTSADVRDLTFRLPVLAEQQAIGEALANCDTELSVLNARLRKARDVKQGMMQELLTGRTRLPVAEEVA